MNIKHLTILIFILATSCNSWSMNYIVSKFPDVFSSLTSSWDQSRYKAVQASLLNNLTSHNIANAGLYSAIVYVGYKGYNHTQKFNAGNRQISKMLDEQIKKDKEIKKQLGKLKSEIKENTGNLNTLKTSRKNEKNSANDLKNEIMPIQSFFQETAPMILKNIPKRQEIFSRLLDTIPATQDSIGLKNLTHQTTKLQGNANKLHNPTLEKINKQTKQERDISKELKTTKEITLKTDVTFNKTEKKIKKYNLSLKNIADTSSKEYQQFINEVVSGLLKKK